MGNVTKCPTIPAQIVALDTRIPLHLTNASVTDDYHLSNSCRTVSVLPVPSGVHSRTRPHHSVADARERAVPTPRAGGDVLQRHIRRYRTGTVAGGETVAPHHSSRRPFLCAPLRLRLPSAPPPRPETGEGCGRRTTTARTPSPTAFRSAFPSLPLEHRGMGTPTTPCRGGREHGAPVVSRTFGTGSVTAAPARPPGTRPHLRHASPVRDHRRSTPRTRGVRNPVHSHRTGFHPPPPRFPA
ncbi:hypothetical protein FHX37_2081 [Haloactinospora alba]|uniref:Uncharacterized protein n=1 Tax=Haloactinospora alba TaxID=405555 RepID=A0A543NK27_9ACTN|nr:hypothetical protein FHX37_2081 [Haloactinospora alba]